MMDDDRKKSYAKRCCFTCKNGIGKEFICSVHDMGILFPMDYICDQFEWSPMVPKRTRP
jgi:hypothetical protein